MGKFFSSSVCENVKELSVASASIFVALCCIGVGFHTGVSLGRAYVFWGIIHKNHCVMNMLKIRMNVSEWCGMEITSSLFCLSS